MAALWLVPTTKDRLYLKPSQTSQLLNNNAATQAADLRIHPVVAVKNEALQVNAVSDTGGVADRQPCKFSLNIVLTLQPLAAKPWKQTLACNLDQGEDKYLK
jgi:hypothetical protein